MKKYTKQIRNRSFDNPEIAHLKGKVEAIKHYYSILIAKNVEKVERSINTLSSTIDKMEESTYELLPRFTQLESKINRAKNPSIKKLLISQLEVLSDLKGSYEKRKEEALVIKNDLRQII